MYSIVGREYVLSVLTGYLDATLKDSGASILLEGSIGVGKSRLLNAVALEGAERGLAVTYIRAGEGGEAAIVRELIIFLRHVISGEVEFNDREFQDLVRPDANPFLLADNLSEMIKAAARRRPLLIILDDAQLVDDVSSVALQGLMRSPGELPVLSVIARRPVSAHSIAQHAIGWLCEHATAQLRLGPLDDEAVAALCANILGAKPDASVLSWASRCGGNPWLLETLMGALREAGRLVILDGTASVLAESLPESVLSAIHRLLDGVPPGVRDLLVHGGRVGPRFTVDDPALSSSVDEAVQVGLVRRSGEKLAFVHEVLGSAMQIERAPSASPACGCEQLAPRVISALGDRLEAPPKLARALSLLAGAGRAAEASHLAGVAARAGLDATGEARLVLDLVPGLRNAGCPGLAVEHLQRTLARNDLRERDRTELETLLAEMPKLEHEPTGTEEKCPSWGWLIRALLAADRFEEASAVAGVEPRWHAYRAEVLLAQGWLAEARVAAERMAESVPAHAVLAEVGLHQGDTAAAGEHLRIAESLSPDAADKNRLEWTVAQYHAACGHSDRAVKTLLNPDMLFFAEAPTAAATLVRLAAKAGLGAEAERAADLARQVSELNPDVASLAGGAEHAEGLLHHDRDALRRAVEYYRHSGRPLATGIALEDIAQDRPQAAELQGSVDNKLQSAGRQEVERSSEGWDSLTSAELRVVRAIVDGKTNKEAASSLFLSPHTIDSHLRRVFGKLGINTRVELTKHFLSHEAS